MTVVLHEVALVLRVQSLGEADAIVGLVSAGLGRFDVVARGARSSRKRFGGVLRPFCELEVVAQRPRVGSLPLLASATLRRDVLGDTVSYPQLCLASYLVDMAQQAAQPGHADAALYQWLVAWLEACRGDVETLLPQLKLAAEAGLLHTLGLLPDLRHCVRCSSMLEPAGYWPPDGEGLGCPTCTTTHGRDAIDGAALLALQSAVTHPGWTAARALPPGGQRILQDRVGRKVQLSLGVLRSERSLRDLL